MYIEYECGCTSNKTIDNERCENHWWAEVTKIVSEEVGLFYEKSTF